MSQNIALVLSGGAARGIAHIGVIEELLDQGYRITSIAGTSMGSVIGGIYAAGHLEEYKEWVLTTTKMDVVKLLDLTLGKGGLVKGEKVISAMENFIKDRQIEDLNIPFAAVAADIRNHCEKVFTSGDLLFAIRASISIPTVFKPVMYENSYLVDGGILNPLPLNVVERTPGDIMVAVNVNAHIPYVLPETFQLDEESVSGYSKAFQKLNKKWSRLIHSYSFSKEKEIEPVENTSPADPPGLFEVMTESLLLIQDKLCQDSIEKFSPEIVVNVSHKSASAYDFYKATELIEAGRLACRQALTEYIGKTYMDKEIV